MKVIYKSKIHLWLLRLPILISLEYLKGDFLEAGDRAYDANDEDDRNQSEGHLHVTS